MGKYMNLMDLAPVYTICFMNFKAETSLPQQFRTDDMPFVKKYPVFRMLAEIGDLRKLSPEPMTLVGGVPAKVIRKILKSRDCYGKIKQKSISGEISRETSVYSMGA